MIANYHTHTYRCQHAGDFTDEEYVLRAIENGFRVIGFSDHAPWQFSTGFVSRFRMLPDEFPDYCSSVRHLKEKYDGKIKILLGLESEYYPEYFQWMEKLRNELDYMLFGSHWSVSEEYGMAYAGKVTEAESVLQYFRHVVEGLKTGLFTYVAHPDLVLSNYPEFDAVCEEGSYMLCEAAKTMDLPLEYNISGFEKIRKGLQKSSGYPNSRFWEIAAEMGCKAVIGLDAHSPEAFANETDIRTAEDVLTGLGIDLLETLPGL